MKRRYKVLDNKKDLVEFKPFEEDSDERNLQGTAISSLVFLDKTLDEYKLTADNIEGILFCTRSYEYALRYGNIEPTTIFIITNKIKKEYLPKIQEYLSLLDFLDNDQKVLNKLKEERCFLIYGNERLKELVGKEYTADNYIPKYRDRFKELE